ncbi:cyclin-H-like [Pomacea canaliculata]|uniref:cyclin-H-like n=1 Tax=Pomacea canaliculata TaxID=400727 RepID=UPI000D7344A7|nr:cyclin-H-like [Pomacea canaliculata]
MFATSTQRKFWTFTGETELTQLRKEANQKYIQTHGENMSDEEIAAFFLTPAEERLLVRQYEFVLREFCNKFQPPFPKYILGTSLMYFKRFWVNNSVMDYHPKDIMLTCVYLACKVEEFYVAIGQFVSNLKGNREKFADTILAFELLLMSKLQYHLTIHHPYRPLEGLLIDIKTRFPDLDNPERLRKGAEEYIERCLLSDVVLIFSPSQIALASIMYSAGRESINMDRYMTEILMAGCPEDEVQKCIYQLRRIKHMVKSTEPIPREQAHLTQKKMEKCRNQENNPDSEIYRARMAEMFEDEEETRNRKRARKEQETQKTEEDIVL